MGTAGFLRVQYTAIARIITLSHIIYHNHEKSGREGVYEGGLIKPLLAPQASFACSTPLSRASRCCCRGSSP
jgi:hypothetical protein